jgi:sterol desaturase/sphingolipid hydroxylase (fatty acid hydroxylase superfamily)
VDAGSMGLYNIGALPLWFRAVVVFLLFDLWMYWWHRSVHRVPFMWRFRRMHHTDPAMDATTALRFHPGELALSWIFRCLVFVLLGMNLVMLAFYESVLLVNIFFHHSNIHLPPRIDRSLRHVIVTPDMHRVHHSNVGREVNSNYSTMFSWWDRIFHSYREREDTRTITFGLRILREPFWQTLRGMLYTPFK